MYFLIYKTTNKTNGKYYIGAHKTKIIEDGYLGSGKILLDAVKKYGKENFDREILFLAKNSEEMYAKERDLVNEELVNDPQSYNLKIGGSSNFYYVNKHGKNIEMGQNQIHGDRCKNDPEYREWFSAKMAPILRENGLCRRGISPKNKGSKWVRRGEDHRMIGVEDVETFLSEGWELAPPNKGKSSSNKGSKKMKRSGETKMVKPLEFENHLETGWQFL